jgi:hypothetical protein
MLLEHIAENLVLVTKTSLLSGKTNSMALPIRQGQVEYWQQSGELIQNVFPHLDADQREFLMTGITPEEWAGM